MNKKSAISIFLVIIMLGSVIAVFVSGESKNSKVATNNTTDIEAPSIDTIAGEHIDHQLDSIADGIAMSPAGITSAQFVDFTKVYNSQLQMFEPNATQMAAIYNVWVTKEFSAVDSNIDKSSDSVFQLHSIYPEVVNFQYVQSAEPYDGYYLLSRGNNYSNVVGSPMLLGSETRIKNVLDVLSGNAEASHDFDYLLSKTEPGAEIQIVSSDKELTADQYYLEFKAIDNETYARKTIYLNLNQSVLTKFNSLAENSSSRGLDYDIAEDGDITTVVVKANASNLLSLAFEPYS